MTKKKTHNKTILKALDGERRCLVCGSPLPKEEMIRFTKGPDGFLYADVEQKLGGRGVWVTAQKGMIAQAVKKQLFSKGLQEAVKIEDELEEKVVALLRTRCLHFLALANKSGAVLYGFEKIKEKAAHEDFGLYCQASDGSEKEEKRLAEVLKGVPTCALFNQKELGTVLGRDFCVHFVLKKCKLTESLKKEISRLTALTKNEETKNDE